ncbi:MAG: adenylate/guanylate cyclase domain-containing protein [Myxococcales bacterium]|nr:adenylate/guanylate cyclase domain-containing protein [Myxococcales bacterium]
MLPREIAERIKDGEKLIADRFEDVSVLFVDIVGFTQLAREMKPRELVELLNEFFTIVDLLVGEHHLEKIKTIGDAYMIVSGVPRKRDDHATAIADLALAIRGAIDAFNAARGSEFQVRAGINSGPTVAGIIGVKKFAYDLWGDTVNLASRMESSGEPGRIQVTEATRALLEDEFILSPRGVVQVKGIGEIETYWLEGRRPPASGA